MSIGPIKINASRRYLFDRTINSSHPWTTALDDLEKSPEPTHQYVCSNWRMDHRVCRKRGNHMQNTGRFPNVLKGPQWLVAVRNYFGDHVCRPANPSLGGRSCGTFQLHNANNIVLMTVSPHNLLVHAASLNRMVNRLVSNQHGDFQNFSYDCEQKTGIRLPVFPRTTSAHSAFYSPIFGNWANELANKGAETIKKLAGFMVKALGENQPPWWACFNREVNSLIQNSRWTELCRALGLGHISTGEWLLIWRYRIMDVGQVVRPTVIEAYDSPYHFPSPPNYPCGITMPLYSGGKACREILHAPPLNSTVAADANIGKLCHIDRPVIEDYNKVADFRHSHAEKLSADYRNKDNHGWFERHRHPMS